MKLPKNNRIFIALFFCGIIIPTAILAFLSFRNVQSERLLAEKNFEDAQTSFSKQAIQTVRDEQTEILKETRTASAISLRAAAKASRIRKRRFIQKRSRHRRYLFVQREPPRLPERFYPYKIRQARPADHDPRFHRKRTAPSRNFGPRSRQDQIRAICTFNAGAFHFRTRQHFKLARITAFPLPRKALRRSAEYY